VTGASERVRQRVFRLSADDALPLRIEHQRIYILPTPRGWAFLAALLLMLVATINYALSLGYALCFLLGGLFAASLLHTYRNLAGLEVRAIGASDTFAGRDAAFRLTLSTTASRARHGIALGTRDRLDAARLSLARGESASAALPVPTVRRGHRALGRLTLSSDWPLGLWRAWSYVHAPAHALVYPAPEASPPPLPQRAVERGRGVAPAAGEGDVAGLRAYAEGDRPSRIAWSSVARGGELQVRLLEQAGGPARTTLDLDAAALSSLEAGLSRLCAWVDEAARQDTSFSLSLPGTPALPPGRGEAHRRKALSALALHGIDRSPSSTTA